MRCETRFTGYGTNRADLPKPAVDRPSSIQFRGNEPHQFVEIMRLVLAGSPKPQAAQALLRQALHQWPNKTQARFLLTPGGFMEAPWPTGESGKQGWESRPEDLQPLIHEAEKAVTRLLTPELKALARQKVHYITLGVDVTTAQGMKGPHAELVCVYDTRQDKIAGWTGKSYPLAVQENTLTHCTDLDSHLFRLDDDRVMVLGCHDLNMFSPRAYANQKPDSLRRVRADEMRQLATDFDPTLVLQHPHGTDTPNIWRAAWVGLQRLFPHVQTWASGIGFYNFLAPSGSTRASLDRTLNLTKSNPCRVQDLILDTRPYA